MLKPYITKAINRQDLSASEAEAAMTIIMTGQATQAQIGAYLIALRMKGETVEEITGSARAMRAQCQHGALTMPTAARWSTPPAPAATARTPSTSPPRRRSSSPARGARWPSTATARPPRSAAAPMC